jgi:ring-1,2-phenylacetyl-CoA epoxidase subunit PaaC
MRGRGFRIEDRGSIAVNRGGEPKVDIASAITDGALATGDPSILDPRSSLLDYVLRLADNGLVLAQRLGEWVGKGPVLEEDIASTNVGLDLLGQARLWLAYASEIDGRTEDQFAYFRDGAGFRNLLLVEQPNGNYADTIARQYLFDQWHALLLAKLVDSSDARIAAIAAKALTEVRYHVERSADWVIRLGDGTELSHARMQAAIDALWMYTGEMFSVDATERALIDGGVAADVEALREPWIAALRAILAKATLALPRDPWMQGSGGRGGKQGVHTEHLSRMLASMQVLPRTYPDARW